jgi:cytochrome P450
MWCGVLQALSWTFYLLLQHPEVEQKLLAEIHQVLGPQQQPTGSSKDSSKAGAADADAAAGADSSGSAGVLRPSYDQLRQLKYARAVFMEALRLYPSVPEVSGVLLLLLLVVVVVVVLADCRCPRRRKQLLCACCSTARRLAHMSGFTAPL